MICSNCQKESNPASRICPFCGKFMGEEQRFIKGEAVPVYDDSDYQAHQPRAVYGPVKGKAGAKQRRSRKGRAGKKPGRDAYRRHMINWALAGLIALIAIFTSAIGAYVYLNVTSNGQLIMARLGRNANADAYWTLGTEYLDQGYVGRSIQAYEKALNIEPEHKELVARLMLLGEAYEAGGQQGKAEAVYTRIYQELEPTSPLGYRNAIRLMLQEDRQLEATKLMQLAFEQTNDESFAKQRSSFVPLPPSATVSGGRYLISKSVAFQSPQGYEIYYAIGQEVLPEEGRLYEGPITLGEGVHDFRAVCVSSMLISDEMSVRYIITLPTPPAPKTNLQPDQYSGVRTVRLRDMETDKSDPLKKTQLYYTIDGRPATIDSPRYMDEPVQLPGGRVTLRAIAVNGYGKVSNELNVVYEIKAPFKKYFNETDEFVGLKLMDTSYDAFTKVFGEPQASSPIEDDAVTGSCLSAQYAWGEARFVRLDTGEMLYHLDSDDPQMTGPRNTKIGMTMKEVTDRFRDMGQLPSDKGDRGIYYDIVAGYADYAVASDDPTTGTLAYVAVITGQTTTTRLLTYQIKNDKVDRIILRYVDRKISNVQ